MKPPIGRIGGKRVLKARICVLIPKHTTYVEPFVGSGAVFYYKDKSENEIINDLDAGIFNVHHGLKHHGAEIHELLPRDIDKATFDIFKDTKPYNDVDRAIRDIILSKHSFMLNRINYGNPNGRNRTDYRVYPDRLRNTIVRNEDALEIIKEYDGENTFFYLDPPYENSKATAMYENSSFNLQTLADLLRGLKGKFLLSMNDSPNVRKIFVGFHLTEVETHYKYAAVSKKDPKAKELFIANYML
jgi:DNA adenine methylase